MPVETARLEPWIAAHEAKLAAEAAVRRDAGDARVAAIPGADDAFALGDVFQQAQALLRERIHRYGDEVAAMILREMIAFAQRVPAVPPAAVEALASAGLAACFRDAPWPGVMPPPSEPTLRELYDRLLSESDAQENIDANANAAAYWRAAHLVALASALSGVEPRG